MSKKEQAVRDYYQSLESRLGYRLFLRGEKHLGWHEGSTFGNDRAARRRVMDEVVKRLFGRKKTAGKRILDAGCGLGGPSRYISQKYQLHVDGISIVPFEIKVCRRKTAKTGVSCSYELMSYDDLKFPDQTFDGIYTIETLSHARRPSKVLREFHRTLKPGGRIVLCEYTAASDKAFTPEEKKFGEFAVRVGAGYGMQSLRHGSFEKLLKQAGFEDIVVEKRSDVVEPSLARLHKYAKYPAKVIRKLGITRHFGNTMVAERWYELYKKDLWRYVVVSATKPTKGSRS